MRPLGTLIVSLCLATSACRSDALAPVAFDAAREACRFCRMTGSTGRFAAQIVSRSGEPMFFDDIGCLRDALKSGAAPTGEAAAYVADHRTGAWVRADRAVYTYQSAIATPMSSHLLAHESNASRDADPDVRGGRLVAVGEIFAGVRLPGGPQ